MSISGYVIRPLRNSRGNFEVFRYVFPKDDDMTPKNGYFYYVAEFSSIEFAFECLPDWTVRADRNNDVNIGEGTA